MSQVTSNAMVCSLAYNTGTTSICIPSCRRGEFTAVQWKWTSIHKWPIIRKSFPRCIIPYCRSSIPRGWYYKNARRQCKHVTRWSIIRAGIQQGFAKCNQSDERFVCKCVETSRSIRRFQTGEFRWSATRGQSCLESHDETHVPPEELHCPPCIYWRLAWCITLQVAALIQCSRCCPVVLRWNLMLSHTQCFHSRAWAKIN